MNNSRDQDMLPAAPLKETSQKKRKRFLRADEADKWQEHFEDLCRFKEAHNHCLVPHTYSANPGLGRWVKRQRYENKLLQQNKVSSMTPERLALLEKIGFVWDSHQVTWNKMLGELEDFKKKHGHCEVPSKFPENSALATWVSRQRAQHKLYRKNEANSMTESRIAALNKLDFKWGVRCKEETKKK
mmetsp:Transcript_26342/g.39905  ORF Transcript_26342/g.39905 Transcript_26342/m.39905 type:complete len:186 (-) Transcript_26342:3812-4369(-)